jgi:hypothetical protein
MPYVQRFDVGGVDHHGVIDQGNSRRISVIYSAGGIQPVAVYFSTSPIMAAVS